MLFFKFHLFPIILRDGLLFSFLCCLFSFAFSFAAAFLVALFFGFTSSPETASSSLAIFLPLFYGRPLLPVCQLFGYNRRIVYNQCYMVASFTYTISLPCGAGRIRFNVLPPST
jgi:hypothetical protein